MANSFEAHKVELIAKRADLILSLDLNFDGLRFPSVDEDAPASIHSLSDALIDHAQQNSTGDAHETETTLDENSSGSSHVEVHVSSMHLIEASRYFETLLVGKFQEASEKQIALTEIHAQAFIILMNIVHSRYRHLPKRVEPEILFQLCILIDMYGMHDSTVLQTDLWFECLLKEIPDHSAPNLHHWAFICYVLKKAEAFQAVTATIQKFYIESAVPSIPLPSSYEGEQHQILICAILTGF
ncbi:hypothetical protein H2198_003566 [Neophaeococcomyces mojaviensis]|uniref:Uncharacterized protein n=1 Tax=Neophaeococcomyces mojaviensis TaxID=3383035 RepID=A0ACC3AB31_9EURO|nr:hypothetical protein H2198_003566 [Knufia sp. JES_112]